MHKGKVDLSRQLNDDIIAKLKNRSLRLLFKVESLLGPPLLLSCPKFRVVSLDDRNLGRASRDAG